MKTTKPIPDILLSAPPEIVLQRLRSRAPDTTVQIRTGCYGIYNADGSILLYYNDATNTRSPFRDGLYRCEFHGTVQPCETGTRIQGAFIFRQISRWVWIIVLAVLALIGYSVLRNGGGWIELLIPTVLAVAFTGFQILLSRALSDDDTPEKKILSVLYGLDVPDEI